MKTVIFITGNSLKFEIAQKALESYRIKLVQQKLDTPEIQSEDVGEVAFYSAKYACELLKKSVIVTDAGYYIESLNGFPGPFIKYINRWLSSADILRLMKGQKNRKVEARDSLAYCEPGKEPVVFFNIFKGTIALKAGKKGMTSINEIFIPNGYNKVSSEIDSEEMAKFWAKGNKWKKLVEYLKLSSK